MQDGIVVAAPCKINIHLQVMGRRSDGFHDIKSVFQALSFGDELRIDSLKERFVCDVRMDGPVPPERNIVYKAVSLFRRRTGFDGGVRIHVEKRIPYGAGLGGGSTDAASTLVALDRLSGFSLSGAELASLAAELGSDVPFFLCGGTALVTGRGELVRSIDSRIDYWVVLAHPGFSSETATAYRLLDESRLHESEVVIPAETITMADSKTLSKAVLSVPSKWPFFNDFLSVLRKASPLYDVLLNDFVTEGACFASLSGSGSVCFGVFSDLKTAEIAVKRLNTRWPFVRLAVPLARTAKAVLE
ncbi:MAG: 4-(cytidine 5'-diphospho)-2-C-methyl-D-erythritol kinase [Treponemataceae bacterium]